MNKHDDCKFFDHPACEHKDDGIMKQATQTLTKLSAGDSMPFFIEPSPEEIDAICSACKKFKKVISK